ncbi:MAG: ABC transporter permease [Bacteroidales bacterium]|nr:ABC transporter permease [Bacteroidales bacterium]
MALGLAARIYTILPESNRIERIWLLAKTDFKVRYSASALGTIWAFVYPLIRILIYYIVFSYVFAKEIPNYGFYIFSGIIIWMYFMEATKNGLKVIKAKQYLLENIRFNKLDVFYSSILTSLIGFIVNISVLICLLIIMGLPPTWRLIYYPLFILNLMILSLGVSLILSTIHVYLKDISQLWELVLLLMFWINPIFFAKQKIFNMFPALLYANPLAGIIINSRDVLIYGKEPDWLLVGYNFFYASIILAVGLWSFNKFFHKAIEKL